MTEWAGSEGEKGGKEGEGGGVQSGCLLEDEHGSPLFLKGELKCAGVSETGVSVSEQQLGVGRLLGPTELRSESNRYRVEVWRQRIR